MFGLYIHIPYCRSKCRYCDFYSTPCPDGVPEAYIDALCREMDRFSPCGSTPLRPDTLYFGGGTPSLLTPAQAARLIRAAGPAPGAEITLEANPETVTPERLAAFRRAGVNRLSLGIQTARDDSLARLGRRHTAAQSRRALGMAVQAGFTDISGDLMLALPAYTMAELDETIALLAESGCTHICGYLLKIEPGTPFAAQAASLELPDEDAAADRYLAACAELASAGYRQYEISNFALPGFESRHNRKYWEGAPYLGVGPSAHSFLGGRRFFYPRSLPAFLRGEPPVLENSRDGALADGSPAEYLMLRLRLTEGLTEEAYRTRFGAPIPLLWRERAAALPRSHILCDEAGIRLTREGFLVSNVLIGRLLE